MIAVDHEHVVLDDLDFDPQCWREHAPADWALRTTCGRVSLICDDCWQKSQEQMHFLFVVGGAAECKRCNTIARSLDDIREHQTAEPLR